MRLKTLSALLLASSSLSACASFKPPAIDYDRDYAPAALNADPPQPVKIVALRTPLPSPGQLKPLPAKKPTPEPKDPAVRVATANEAARVQPTRDGYINAVQVYPFTEGALYQVYAAPGQVTDIALQESEQLVGSGPVAAGDTVRWIIGDTESGTGPSRKVHILAKPTRPDLMTNLVINTDRRTYLLDCSIQLRFDHLEATVVGGLLQLDFPGKIHGSPRSSASHAASTRRAVRYSPWRRISLFFSTRKVSEG